MKTLEHTSSIRSLQNSTPEESDLVILGGGTASQSRPGPLLAKERVWLVIERKYIGGSCPNIACLPSKNIIHSAKVASYFRRSEKFGITRKPFTVDMTAVRGCKRSTVSSAHDVYLENYRFVAPRTVEVGLADETTRKLRGTDVIISTGTRAALRDTILVHPTLLEGLVPLLSSMPSPPKYSKSAHAAQGAPSAH